MSLRDLGSWLAPAGWPELGDDRRGRVRALAWAAIAAQALFVVGWIVAGALEPGYSQLRQYASELGRHGAAHAWIFDVAVVAWGLGFVALGTALLPALAGRPWRTVAPALFMLAGVLAVALAPLRLDCASTVSHLCDLQEKAGTLSWHEYGHAWVSFALEGALLLTPFALARTLWPGRLARLILFGGAAVAVVLLVLASVGLSAGAHTHHGALTGLWQRAALLVVHVWVVLCAGALLTYAKRRPGVAAGALAVSASPSRYPHQP